MKWQAKPWGEKFVPKEQICKSRSWPLQLRWLQRAACNGIRTCAIIGVGAKNGYVILPPFDYESNELLTLQQIATFVENGGKHG